jgi:hypothetical protein
MDHRELIPPGKDTTSGIPATTTPAMPATVLTISRTSVPI